MPRRVFIYALADPRVKHPIRRFFYVGKTTEEPEARLARHLRTARRGRGWRESTRCIRLIRSLLRGETAPSLHILEIVNPAEWQEAEMRHIARLRWLGAPLVNQTLGGAGVRGLKVKKSTRRKMRLAKLGRKASAAMRRKMSSAQRRAWRDPVKRASRIGGMMGHTYSKATLRRMSRAAKGRVIPPKQRRQIAETLTGRKHSKATRQKMSQSHLRQNRNQAFRRRHRAAILRFIKTKAYRAKMSKISKAAWARRKKQQS